MKLVADLKPKRNKIRKSSTDTVVQFVRASARLAEVQGSNPN